ncbi:MAG: hypothetical protein WC588_00700 [Candidatus Micrarchaeia archaeon]
MTGGANIRTGNDAMILYFDNYITDEALNSGAPPWSESVRSGKAGIYRMPAKPEIALYALASYAEIKWSAVVVKYTISDQGKADWFEREVKGIFPKAIIIRGRSDSAEKFMDSARLFRTLGDEWIFYAGNSDYPFIGAETHTIHACLEKAAELGKASKFVSVYLAPSAFGLSLSDPSSLAHDPRWKRIGEDTDCAWSEVRGGYFDAIQIVNIGLFERWFSSPALGRANARVFRSDCVENFADVPMQTVVVPKRDICFHFDGLSHLAIHGYDCPDCAFPPLFIPPGFFEGRIRVAYGYGGYREGWVNVNPLSETYSFIDGKGADLKCTLDRLPLFWRKRISELDANPDASQPKLEEAFRRIMEKQSGAWRATPASSAKKAAKRAVWLATKAPLAWAKRIGGWVRNPDSLRKVLDERDRGAEGRLKSSAKRLIYSAITRFKKK